MPNTEVKLSSAENTCLETDREDRKVLAFSLYGRKNKIFIVSVGFLFLASVHSAFQALRLLRNHRPKPEWIFCKTKYSPIAQSVEHMTVNHGVVGSSPTGGAISRVSKDTLLFLLLLLFCRIRPCEQEEIPVVKMRSRLSKLLYRCAFKEKCKTAFISVWLIVENYIRPLS